MILIVFCLLQSKTEEQQGNGLLDEYNASTLFCKNDHLYVAIATKTRLLFNLVTKRRSEFFYSSKDLILYMRHLLVGNEDYLVVVDISGYLSCFNIDKNIYFYSDEQFTFDGIPYSIFTNPTSEVYVNTIKNGSDGNIEYRSYVSNMSEPEKPTSSLQESYNDKRLIVGVSSISETLYPQMHAFGKELFIERDSKIFEAKSDIVHISIDDGTVAILDNQSNVYVLDIEDKQLTDTSPLVLSNYIEFNDVGQIRYFSHKECIVDEIKCYHLAFVLNDVIYYLDLSKPSFRLKIGEHTKITRLFLDSQESLSVISINRFWHVIHWKKKDLSWYPDYMSYPTFSYIPQEDSKKPSKKADVVPLQKPSKKADVIPLQKRYFCLYLYKNGTIDPYINGDKNTELRYLAKFHPACFQLLLSTHPTLSGAIYSLSGMIAEQFQMSNFRLNQIYSLLESNENKCLYYRHFF